jgi:hypothetical protein
VRLPFTIAQFLSVFRTYNEAVWPLQWVLYGLALVALLLLCLPVRHAGRYISAILAFLWAWMAVMYHWLHFAPINPAATLFACLFLVEAGVLSWVGSAHGGLCFGWPGGARGMVGVLLVLYALGIYPVLNAWLGHTYPASPTFGLPCPTTIFTLGLLCFLALPFSRWILVVPIFWAVVGSTAALWLAVPQDLGLLVAGLAGVALAMRRQRTEPGAGAGPSS